MSVAFTPVTSWNHKLQDLAGANEIVLAYSERRQALGQSAVSALASKSGAQHKDLWLEMQAWLEANCTSFIDHISGPLNPAGDDFRYFTLATWRAAAGLNASGFRRKVERADPFSYGQIQFRDIRGYWNFEDLQAGFGVLKWTKAALSVTSTREKQGGGWPYKTYAEAVAEYNADAWGTATAGERAVAERYRLGPLWDGTWHDTNRLRRCQSQRSVSLSVVVPRSVEMWVKVLTTGDPSQFGYAGTVREWSFSGHGDALSENVFALAQTIAEGVVNPVTFSYWPVDTAPLCPPDPPSDHSYIMGWDIAAANGLVKWNFTNI